jgi:hypothetical protein
LNLSIAAPEIGLLHINSIEQNYILCNSQSKE